MGVSVVIEICGIINMGGRHGEPLACGFPKSHGGNHSWASLPTFLSDGRTQTERAVDKLLDHIAEFDTIVSQEYVDALDDAVKFDTKDFVVKE